MALQTITLNDDAMWNAGAMAPVVSGSNFFFVNHAIQANGFLISNSLSVADQFYHDASGSVSATAFDGIHSLQSQPFDPHQGPANTDIRIGRQDATLFTLLSIQLDAATIGTSFPVTFIGTTSNGTQVSESFQLDASVGFQTFFFNSSFTNLTSFDLTTTPLIFGGQEFPHISQDVVFDNIVLTVPHTDPTLNLQNIYVGEGSAISAPSFLSVNNPSGDVISQYEFLNEGSNGHFTVNGVSQPNGQWFFVAPGNLASVAYVGGSLPGTDIVEVFIDDQTTNSGIGMVRSATTTGFDPAAFKLGAFGSAVFAGGWSSEDQFPRELADVNGDGLADIVAFGLGGVTVSLASGGGGFGSPTFVLAAFGATTSAGGWTSQDLYPRELADLNGDHIADIVSFGIGGVTVALGTGDGHFGSAFFSLGAFGSAIFAGGWSSQNLYPRELADVNADGVADIVSFGIAGVTVALGTGDGHFQPTLFSLSAFGSSTSAGGWTSQDAYPRLLADVNGDHMADIVGFGIAGVTVALATGGGHFAAPAFVSGAFGSATSAGGWASENLYPRQLADVNGDGLADIVGLGIAGVTVAFGKNNGTFFQAVGDINNFGTSVSAGGWTSQDTFSRLLGDITGDHHADIVGFGIGGVSASIAHNFLLI